MANADICPCKLRLSSSQFSSLGKKTVRDSPPRLDAGEGNSILNFGSAHSTSSSNQTYAAALRILAIGVRNIRSPSWLYQPASRTGLAVKKSSSGVRNALVTPLDGLSGQCVIDVDVVPAPRQNELPGVMQPWRRGYPPARSLQGSCWSPSGKVRT
jgi:hypothetical protein